MYRISRSSVSGVSVAGKLIPVIGGTGLHSAALTIVVPVKNVAALLDIEGVNR